MEEKRVDLMENTTISTDALAETSVDTEEKKTKKLKKEKAPKVKKEKAPKVKKEKAPKVKKEKAPKEKKVRVKKMANVEGEGAAEKSGENAFTKCIASVKALISKVTTDDSSKEYAAKKASALFSIRNKIIACILLPIVFMIIVGVQAYKTAETGMSSKYIDSTSETLQMASEYIDMSAQFLEAETMKYAFDMELSKYLMGLYNSSLVEKNMVKDKVRTSMLSSQTGNDFIRNIHVICDDKNPMFTTKTSDAITGIMTEYTEQVLVDGDRNTLERWTDHHELIDETLRLSSAKDSYFLAVQMYASANNYIVVLDVSQDALQGFIDGIDLGKGSLIGIVSPNGRELINEGLAEGQESSLTEGELVFAGQDFYEKALADLAADPEKTLGYSNVKYKGVEHLFMYSKSVETGCVVCALVPTSYIVGQADAIKNTTVLWVVIALVIVMGVGLFIVFGIQKNMNRIAGKFGEVAQGDLTVTVTVQGRDEFQNLAGSATNMISNTKNLVHKVADATTELEASSEAVGQASQVLENYSQEISQAVNEINSGMERQMQHAQECVDTTTGLSNELKRINELVNKVEGLVSETGDMINQGMGLIHQLGESAQETTRMTKEVSDSIESLKKDSENINSFVGVITDISSQTNLLSLNASIEAARAGEAGRGFAVVAEEIRKLADDSAKAAGEIKRNVAQINNQTTLTVNNAGEAERMVEEQSESVTQAVSVLQQMQERMNDLVDGLHEISGAMDQADAQRHETVKAVKSISEIIDENAEYAGNVMSVAEKLQDNVEGLNATAQHLDDNMQDLKTEISVFKV